MKACNKRKLQTIHTYKSNKVPMILNNPDAKPKYPPI